MTAYYNEHEPYAVEWLRNLIKQGLIADGEVDGRSIVDVRADDLGKFTQCHFFAGIGVWSYALRLAGWPDDRPVWTGSCPCQPFSAAGKGAGFADERHLWPEFHRLISECHPPVVFGEQVASKDGLGWLDTVQSDMEASGYAIGAADLCAASVGAPHIRQRLWFVGERLADAQGQRYVQREVGDEGGPQRAAGGGRQDEGLRQSGPSGASGDGGLANAALDGRRQGIEDGGRLRGGDRAEGSARRSAIDSDLFGGLGHHHHQGLEGQRRGHQAEAGRLGAVRPVAETGELGGLEHASGLGRERGQASAPGHDDDGPAPGRQEGEHGAGLASPHRLHQDGARPADGHWRAADWLHCRDGKWRPVEPGTFPLAHGAPARVGRLRAYGNAIVPQVAAEIIQSFMECRT